MNLRILQDYIDRFSRYLPGATHASMLHFWESQQNFQKHWDPDAPDLAAMYDQSLQNTHSRRLWTGHRYEPKRVMLAFINLHPDFVRDMFRDLFREQYEVEGRMGRFAFHCDELLREYKEANPTSVENNHYHDDGRMVSVYLSLHAPELYAPYQFESFRVLLERLQAKEPPKVDDAARYFKVMRIIQTMLMKQEAVLAAQAARLDNRLHYTGNSLLLAREFCDFVAEMESW